MRSTTWRSTAPRGSPAFSIVATCSAAVSNAAARDFQAASAGETGGAPPAKPGGDGSFNACNRLIRPLLQPRALP